MRTVALNASSMCWRWRRQACRCSFIRHFFLIYCGGYERPPGGCRTPVWNALMWRSGPGRRDRRIRARAGPLQVKRVVCVHRLVMALHKRGGLRGGLFGWVSRGSLRMFKMYGRTSWSIERPRSVVSEVFDTFWLCHGRIQGVLELLESVTSAVRTQHRRPYRANVKWFHGVLEITGEVQWACWPLTRFQWSLKRYQTLVSWFRFASLRSLHRRVFLRSLWGIHRSFGELPRILEQIPVEGSWINTLVWSVLIKTRVLRGF